MTTGNVRRAQLVSPFGVGAMSVMVDGSSVITAGLDHWYSGGQLVDETEYVEHDWRLERRLGVSEFRLPPDYRTSKSGNASNSQLTVPVLRFPLWHFCVQCKRLRKSTLTMAQKLTCSHHDGSKYPVRMSQVPFVAICESGHLGDFPFNEWVHRSASPSCEGDLRLIATGAGSLEGQRVTCEKCGDKRNLAGILEAKADGTTRLSQRLDASESDFLCDGLEPWLSRSNNACGNQLRGALRSAGNVYFPKIESSIYLPETNTSASVETLDLLRRPGVRMVLDLLVEDHGHEIPIDRLRAALKPRTLFDAVADDEILAGVAELLGGQSNLESSVNSDSLSATEDWRRPEFDFLRGTPSHAYLEGHDVGLPVGLTGLVDRVRSIDILRETRALRGFTRVQDTPLKLSEGKALLRRKTLPVEEDWLPAYVVKGEGIYFELDEGALRAWESQSGVQARVMVLQHNYAAALERRGSEGPELTARFVLLHTLAHVLINELVFACGYSSASLRERLYVSDSESNPMAGILIYTAAGDSEGTMGGLVRMSRPENLEAVFRGALRDSRWCSSDPICMELSEAGQGPDSCNLAACHACALLPETSCEQFNRLLDRGLVVGTLNDPDLGFFSKID